MPDYTELQEDYSKYRLERDKEDLNAARILFINGEYRAANNRAYYSMFHSMRALLGFNSFDASKHSGVSAGFLRRYIKTGLLPIEISKMVGAAFTIRNASDYDDMFIASREDTEIQISNGEFVYKNIDEYISHKVLKPTSRY